MVDWEQSLILLCEFSQSRVAEIRTRRILREKAHCKQSKEIVPYFVYLKIGRGENWTQLRYDTMQLAFTVCSLFPEKKNFEETISYWYIDTNRAF